MACAHPCRCCDPCDEIRLHCDRCCKCVPLRLCVEPGSEECSCSGGGDYDDETGTWSGTIRCSTGSYTFTASVGENSEGQCSWFLTIDDGYEEHSLEFPFDDYSVGCSPTMDISSVVECQVSIVADESILVPLVQEYGERCKKYFCGECRCLCRELCVFFSGGPCGGAEEILEVSDDSGPPYSWSGALQCDEFQVVEDVEYPFTFEFDRNEYGECIGRLTIDGNTYEQVITDSCSDFRIVFGGIELSGQYEPAEVTVQCAQCGQCPGIDICCNRVLPRTLHLTYETANELDADSDSPSGGVSYSTELQYQDDDQIWLGWKEDGAGESCILVETVAGFRYHLRFEFQCDLAVESQIVIRVFAAPAYNPITDETFPMPDPFDAEQWDSGTDGPCLSCSVFADSGFTPAGSIPFNPSTESLSLCDPFIWSVNVPDSLRSDQFGEGERLECTCAGVDWETGGPRYIVLFWSFTVVE